MNSVRSRVTAFAVLLVLSSAGLAACQSPQDKSYLDVLSKHNTPMKDKINKVVSDCKDTPGQACTTASNDAKSEADSFNNDLKGQSPPSCITDADGKLKTALGLFSPH